MFFISCAILGSNLLFMEADSPDIYEQCKDSSYVIWEWKLGLLKEFEEGVVQKEVIDSVNLFIKEFSLEKEDLVPFLYNKYFADGDIYITLLFVKEKEKKEKWLTFSAKSKFFDIPMYTDYVVTVSLLTHRVVQFYNGGILNSYNGDLYYTKSDVGQKLKPHNVNETEKVCVNKIIKYLGIPEDAIEIDIFKTPQGFLYFRSKEKSFNTLRKMIPGEPINNFYLSVRATIKFDLPSLDNEDSVTTSSLFETVLVNIKNEWYPLFFIFNF